MIGARELLDVMADAICHSINSLEDTRNLRFGTGPNSLTFKVS